MTQQLLPAIRQVSGDFFVFQQDSAPAHRACKTIKLLQWEMPAFISPNLWPLNSPDLNPVDYKIWGVMRDWVYQKKSEGRERVESDWLRSGPDCNRTWLTMPSTSGADACVPAFELEEDIFSICCDCVSYLGYGSWSSLKIYRLTRYLIQIIASFSGFNISQGSVATHLRWSGIFINNFIANFLLNVSVKEHENRSIFSEDMDKSIVSPFFWLTV